MVITRWISWNAMPGELKLPAIPDGVLTERSSASPLSRELPHRQPRMQLSIHAHASSSQLAGGTGERLGPKASKTSDRRTRQRSSASSALLVLTIPGSFGVRYNAGVTNSTAF